MRLVRDRSPSTESAGLSAAAPPPAPPDASGLDADERSFCEVYYRLHPRLLAVAERFVDPETARDAESEALLKVWRIWPRLGAERRTDRYIVQAVRNAAIDALKAQDDSIHIDDVEEEAEQQTAVDHDATERAQSVKDVLTETLATMPPGRRAVLRAINEERLTYKDAAALLGLSLGTIKTHYRLAMAQLRAAYTRAGYRVAQPPRALLTDPSAGDSNA